MKAFPDPYDRMTDDEVEQHVGNLIKERKAQGLPIERMADKSVSISLRLAADVLVRLKAVAREQGVAYQTLMKQWIERDLVAEEAERAGTYRIVLREEVIQKARTTGLLLVIEGAGASSEAKEAGTL